MQSLKYIYLGAAGRGKSEIYIRSMEEGRLKYNIFRSLARKMEPKNLYLGSLQQRAVNKYL